MNVLKCSEFTSDGADQPSQVLWYQIFCDHSDIEQFLDRCTHCICARVDAHTHADEYVYFKNQDCEKWCFLALLPTGAQERQVIERLPLKQVWDISTMAGSLGFAASSEFTMSAACHS